MINDRQRSEEIFKLLAMHRLEHLWVEPGDGEIVTNGPKSEGLFELTEILASESRLSFGERIIVRVAFDFWNGNGDANIWEMMVYLDKKSVLHVISMMTLCISTP